MVYIFMADGTEEIEALTVVDLLRRAGIEIKTVSVEKTNDILGSHGIPIKCDINLSDVSALPEMIVLPGGKKGTETLKANETLAELIRKQNDRNGYLAAVCAAPTIYGEMGLLMGRSATCYPGLEEKLIGAKVQSPDVTVAVDDNFITSRGLGTSIDFALKIIELLLSKEDSDKIAKQVVYR